MKHRTVIKIFSCAAIALALSAQTAELLTVGKSVEGSLAPGQKQNYSISLHAGDLLCATAHAEAPGLLIALYTPSGKRYKDIRIGTSDTAVNFPALEGGALYRVEVGNPDKPSADAKPVSYRISGVHAISADQRLVDLPASKELRSARIFRLREDLTAGTSNALPAFWDEVRAKGTPLLEPVEGDKNHTLATFLWKGNLTTRNVVVAGQFGVVAVFRSMENARMSRLADTDVWYKSVLVRSDERFEYQLGPDTPIVADFVPNPDDPDTARIMATWQSDPLNSHRWPDVPDNPNLTPFDYQSMVEMPNAPPQPWIVRKPDVPAGKVSTSQLTSKLLANHRTIGVYTPPDYSKERGPYNLLFLFDFGDAVTKLAPVILDNLTAAGKIAPTIAVMIGNGSTPNARTLELTANPVMLQFFKEELLPWVRGQYNVTSDPARTSIGGCSLGGLSAAYAGLHASEIFGNIISLSGSFWWTPAFNLLHPVVDRDQDPSWLAGEYVKSPLLPLRFFLDAGTNEFDGVGNGGILDPSRRMRDVLLAKGYEVHYHEFAGGHDYLSWREELADAMIALSRTPVAGLKPNN